MRSAEATPWHRVQLPAALSLSTLLALGLLLAFAPEGVTVATLQPGDGLLPLERWGGAIERAPGVAVAFFLGDTLFAVALVWTFLRLRQALPDGPLAAIAIGAALVKAGADVVENLLYLWPAAYALLADAVSWPPAGALAALAMLKRAAGAATGVAFAFAWPGESAAARVARLLLASLGVAAALGFFFDALALAHVTLVFLFLAFLLWYAPRAADDH
jgi:hypothetical protein